MFEIPLRDPNLPVGAEGFCEFPSCENEIDGDGEVVLVSYGLEVDQVFKRRACFQCAEAYHTGAQHGRFRAMRVLAEERDRCDAREHAGQAVLLERYMRLVDGVDDPAETEAKWEHERTEDGD